MRDRVVRNYFRQAHGSRESQGPKRAVFAGSAVTNYARHYEADDRAQLSLSVVEAAVGVVFVLAVTAGFALGVPQPDARDAQLEAYADDAAAVLASEPPRHQGATRLAELVRSADAFARERAALDRRVDRILPDNLVYRVETTHGAVGYRKPAGVAVGKATVTTFNGEVTILVWYA